jgi:hypothetical protein
MGDSSGWTTPNAELAVAEGCESVVLVCWGWLNTSSMAGRPLRVELTVGDVMGVRCWVNGYGNPSYTFRLVDGSVLYLVDDYGAMNGLWSVGRVVVARRKDLFAGWL